MIVPDSVDYKYLHKFRFFVNKLIKKYKIVIVTGGGKTARRYIEGLKREKVGEVFYSLVGIMATKLNARLIAGIFNLKEQYIISIIIGIFSFSSCIKMFSFHFIQVSLD